MRAFLAVELGEKAKASVEELIRELERVEADVRWVNCGNIHLTLEFFADLGVEKVEKLDGAIRGIAARQSPFSFLIGEAGVFPNLRRPRVFWLGVGAGRDELCALRSCLHEALEAEGIEGDDKPFRPHITLGRARSSRGAEAVWQRLQTAADREFGETWVDRVTLFESQLRPGGALHTPVRVFPLGSCS